MEVNTWIMVLKVSQDDLSIEATYSSMPMDKPSGAYSIAYNYTNKSVVGVLIRLMVYIDGELRSLITI